MWYHQISFIIFQKISLKAGKATGRRRKQLRVSHNVQHGCFGKSEYKGVSYTVSSGKHQFYWEVCIVPAANHRGSHTWKFKRVHARKQYTSLWNFQPCWNWLRMWWDPSEVIGVDSPVRVISKHKNSLIYFLHTLLCFKIRIRCS